MPTKLKNPITVTFAHVENVVATILRAEIPLRHLSGRGHVIAFNAVENEMCGQLESALTAQGIDYRTWEPPKPLIVAGHEATFNPDGSVKVGCQTIPKETIELVVKRWQEAGKVEDVWPKWCRNGNRDSRSIIEFHQDHEKSVWHYSNGNKHPVDNYSSYEDAVSRGLVPITALEAARILGKEQKEEWPKWFKSDSAVYRIDSETRGDSFHFTTKSWSGVNWRLYEMSVPPVYDPITREQAEALIGKQSLTSPE